MEAYRRSTNKPLIYICCLRSTTNFQSTTNFSLKIQSQVIVETVLRDVLVMSDMKVICRDADQKVDTEVAKNLFENLVILFIRVRCQCTPLPSQSEKNTRHHTKLGKKIFAH